MERDFVRLACRCHPRRTRRGTAASGRVVTVVIAALLGAGTAAVAWSSDDDPDELREEARDAGLDSLKTVSVPLPSTIGEYVRDQRAAIALGKALFWDQQAGSDGIACASCHFHAGADARVRNQISPGLIGGNGRFDPLPSGPASGGPNHTLSRSDFPLHRKVDPRSNKLGSNVAFDTDDIVSSAGVAHLTLRTLGPSVKVPPVTQDVVTARANRFHGVTPSSATPATVTPLIGRRPTAIKVAEQFEPVRPDPLGFTIPAGSRRLNTRRVEVRNTPTVINAAFNHRNFWDGRANFHFNGRNPFGPRDPEARVWSYRGSVLEPVAILIDHASLASQAVGPVESIVEMAAHQRRFLDVGRKLLRSTPLVLQSVAATDSVLGPYTVSSPNPLRNGLKTGYDDLIRQAFVESWWGAPGEPVVIDGQHYSQMEANFSLFWGLAIMLYERTLVSDESPFDRFMEGDDSALTPRQRTGLKLFLDEGKCVGCHAGPEFTSAATGARTNRSGSTRFQLINRMPAPSAAAIYDEGYYNIGVRPAFEDLGVGDRDPFGAPLSFSAQATGQGPTVDVAPPFADPDDFEVDEGEPPAAGERIAVAAAFKTPTLRNVDLTGPYFHNGGSLTLEQVVQFYARGSDFKAWNGANGVAMAADIQVLSKLNGNRDDIRAVASFMRALTDPRVAFERAPFDHPSLALPDGHVAIDDTAVPGVARSTSVVMPAVGAEGLAKPIQPFLGGSLVGPDGVPSDDGLR